MFEDSKILITGGTGSLGQALTRRLLEKNVKSRELNCILQIIQL